MSATNNESTENLPTEERLKRILEKTEPMFLDGHQKVIFGTLVEALIEAFKQDKVDANMLKVINDLDLGDHIDYDHISRIFAESFNIADYIDIETEIGYYIDDIEWGEKFDVEDKVTQALQDLDLTDYFDIGYAITEHFENNSFEDMVDIKSVVANVLDDMSPPGNSSKEVVSLKAEVAELKAMVANLVANTPVSLSNYPILVKGVDVLNEFIRLFPTDVLLSAGHMTYALDGVEVSGEKGFFRVSVEDIDTNVVVKLNKELAAVPKKTGADNRYYINTFVNGRDERKTFLVCQI